MGSLRNPIGPLPSSIYWRRRAVVLSVLAVLALLITWVVVARGDGGDQDRQDGANGKNPASSITPGPSGSGPAISQAPGGRDESDSGDAGSGEDAGNGNDVGGGPGSGAGESGGDGSGGSDGSGRVTGVGAGDTLPAGSGLPDCAANAVALSLRSVRNSYAPGETPAFELTVRNTSGSDCTVDLGPRHAVLTITPASGDDAYWSSDDCPEGAGSLTYRVAAGGGIAHTVRWDRKPSAPECGTPPAGSAGAGTYLVQATAGSLGKAQTSFVLKND